ncbi:CHRD domain-containing protein [Candidatus Rariloculus sp.]|uniref:CHRD domain-containing protein n=1 Tax=Candidatus Rariloculus sp. TaxID=3101265 RepID=UPI003D11BBFC
MAPVVLLAAAALSGAEAQQARSFEVRLAAAPRDTAMREFVAGGGSVEATLVGGELTIAGSFEGLKSEATRARIHIGSATGVRGPGVYELEVSKAMAGTISGVVELSDDTLARLDAGHLYIQIDSDSAPEGNLWGWLLWRD